MTFTDYDSNVLSFALSKITAKYKSTLSSYQRNARVQDQPYVLAHARAADSDSYLSCFVNQTWHV